MAACHNFHKHVGVLMSFNDLHASATIEWSDLAYRTQTLGRGW
jgi:hypothetical protein